MLTCLLAHDILRHKVDHFDLGQTSGLELTADFDVDIDENGPVNQLAYKVHFLAKNKDGQVVDEKRVDLGRCFRKPNAFVVADKFHQGYKQVFISLQYGGVSSFLFAFKNKKFYTAFLNDQARVHVRVLPSSKPVWRVEESDSTWHQTLDEEATNSRVEDKMVYQTWTITPKSKPIVRLAAPEAVLVHLSYPPNIIDPFLTPTLQANQNRSK